MISNTSSLTIKVSSEKALQLQLTCEIIKLKALLVVRRIISWQILHMDKCVCVVHYLTRVYSCDLMLHIFFAFTHTCHMLVLFKLWVISNRIYLHAIKE